MNYQERRVMIKFGVCIPQDGMSYQRIRKVALKSEELEFDSIWLFDHLHSFPHPDKDPFLECWTTLSALAQATKRIRLGSLVLNAQYRNPALVAVGIGLVGGDRSWFISFFVLLLNCFSKS